MAELRRYYPVIGAGVKRDPAYDRVARGLDDGDLSEEISLGLGTPDYQAALERERDRRERGDHAA